MAGPWEQFQQAAPAATGPWAQFQPPPSTDGIPGMRRSAADLIPGNIPPGQPEPSALTVGNILSTAAKRPLEVLEVPIALGANMLAGIPTYLTGGAPEVQNWLQKNIMYQPRGQLAREALSAVGKGFEESKLPPFMPAVAAPGMLQKSLTPATRAIIDTGQAAAATSAEALAQPFVRRAVEQGQRNLAQSYQNAAQIEAAQLAQKHGIAVNPVVANPTQANKAKAVLAGTGTMDPYFAQQNQPKWTNLVKKDLGMPANSVLDAAAYDKALDKASKPYDPVRNVVMQPTDEVVQSLEAVRIPETIGAEGAAPAVNKLVDNAQRLLTEGRTGDDVLRDIRQLRRNANSIYQSQKAGMAPNPADVATADASIKLANTLEQLIDANVSDPQALKRIQMARTRLAQIYDLERATDNVTGQIDPAALADALRNNPNMTGIGADIGKIAGNFPGVAQIKPGAAPILPSAQRGGVGAAIGAPIGGAIGGPVGAGVGMVAGGSIGAAVRPVMARRFGTPEYQAAHAIPRDYRPPIYQPPPPETPNFVMQGGPYVPEEPVLNKMLGYNPAAPDIATAQMNRLRTEDVLQRGADYRAAQQAEAQQAAAETMANVGKRTTNRAMNLEWDPVAQVYREAAPQGAGGVVGGLTPLESAVQKMSGQVMPETTGTTFKTTRITPKTGAEPYTRVTRREGETAFERKGQAFAMTAEEKIAWNKAKADLAEVMPSMKSLPDEAIAAKMMDRDFAAQAVANARAKVDALAKQEAALAEQLANRNNLRLLAREIEAKNKQLAKIQADRQNLMAFAEQMEEGLRAPRPVSTGGQGPKTRAAIRNRLIGGENQNALTR